LADSRYRLDEGYAAHVNADLVSAARDFLSGEAGAIATARKMTPYLHLVESERADLAEAMEILVGIDSETDALPIGRVRDMWHPSTAAVEDTKVKHAEEIYHKDVAAVCNEVLRILA
jgi:hypothetical protein